MDFNFSFRSDRYDFWPIYEAIARYYPLGIERREGGIYYEYPGIKELEKLVVENIHEAENYKARWKDKLDSWTQEISYDIRSTTYGQAPSFSASVILENRESADRQLEKHLNFSVSLIGPFYTIYGTDHTAFIEPDIVQERRRHYRATHRVVVSPHGEFVEPFAKLRELIEQEFPGYRFVPYGIHSMIINGLEVRYLDDKVCRIYHALFNNLFEFKIPIVGEHNEFGLDQWFIENPNMENPWVIYPPKSSPQ